MPRPGRSPAPPGASTCAESSAAWRSRSRLARSQRQCVLDPIAKPRRRGQPGCYGTGFTGVGLRGPCAGAALTPRPARPAPHGSRVPGAAGYPSPSPAASSRLRDCAWETDMRVPESARPQRSPVARWPGPRPGCRHRHPSPQATKQGAGTTARTRPPWAGASSWEPKRLQAVRRARPDVCRSSGGAACRTVLAAPQHGVMVSWLLASGVFAVDHAVEERLALIAWCGTQDDALGVQGPSVARTRHIAPCLQTIHDDEHG